MTITNITADRRYPMPGEVVTLSANFNAGSRVRFKLLSKPTESKLEVFDDARGNYLTRSQIRPDVAGSYILEGVEEVVSAEAPRFSNDLGNASAHGGAVRGVESVTQIATLIPVAGGTVIGGRMRYCLPVAERVSRQIGIQPDDVTFTCWCVGSHETVETLIPIHYTYDAITETMIPDQWLRELRPATEGVITRYADRALAPSLSVSPKALVSYAATTPETIAAMTEIGGGTYGDAWQEDDAIMSWDRVIESDPYSWFASVADAANAHITRMDTSVHGVADVVNVLAAPAGNSLAAQTTFLNNLRTVLLAHASHAGHTNPDAITIAAMNALAPLVAPTQDDCSERTNTLWTLLDSHITRLYTASGNNVQCHLKPADNRLPKTAKAIDAATAAARQTQLAFQYNAHRQREQTNPTYHNALATAAETYTDALPDNRDCFVTAVGALADCVSRHCENMSAAGVSTPYHLLPDHSAVLASLKSKPSTFDAAIVTLETIAWTLATHAAKGSPQHDAVWPGAARPSVYGLQAVADAFTTALQSSLPASPGGNECVASLRFEAAGWKVAS